MKPISVRVSECIQIRSQLQSMGVFTIPENSDIASHAMNEFLTQGLSSEFTLTIPDSKQKTMFRVSLTTDPRRQSGVTMVKSV